MLNTLIRTTAAVGVVSLVAVYAGQARAAAFSAWEIQGVA